ncbi:hypothetical protein [Paenibacillus sp. MMS18-CY102]|uniref:hypothetical protein n=1 Tax=Paenibacillus sp. MMS18-CY102 TaxID=2682849 RepID=UPI0013659BA1|nr:hypothetical protein [Paenibacillus sp. MMS18-CY102]MWC31075.1 hypothetical protein [Paenibacillus sp. MMS18-CY102]
MNGTAKRSKDGKSAVFTKNDMNLTVKQKGDTLVILTDGDISSYGGIGVVFGGTFVKRETMEELDLVDLDVFASKKTHDAFKKFIGDDYVLFTSSMQFVVTAPSEDDPHITIVSSGVRGLYTFSEMARTI